MLSRVSSRGSGGRTGQGPGDTLSWMKWASQWCLAAAGGCWETATWPQTLLYVKSKPVGRGNNLAASSPHKDYCFWKRSVSQRIWGSSVPPLSTQGLQRPRVGQRGVLKADDGVKTWRESLCQLRPNAIHDVAAVPCCRDSKPWSPAWVRKPPQNRAQGSQPDGVSPPHQWTWMRRNVPIWGYKQNLHLSLPFYSVQYPIFN